MLRRIVLLSLGWLAITSPMFATAEELPRAMPAGEFPRDVRLKDLKDLDGYFPFTVPTNVNDWNVRRERVIRQILVLQGVWPLPTKTPLNPVIHGTTKAPATASPTAINAARVVWSMRVPTQPSSAGNRVRTRRSSSPRRGPRRSPHPGRMPDR